MENCSKRVRLVRPHADSLLERIRDPQCEEPVLFRDVHLAWPFSRGDECDHAPLTLKVAPPRV